MERPPEIEVSFASYVAQVAAYFAFLDLLKFHKNIQGDDL